MREISICTRRSTVYQMINVRNAAKLNVHQAPYVGAKTSFVDHDVSIHALNEQKMIKKTR